MCFALYRSLKNNFLLWSGFGSYKESLTWKALKIRMLEVRQKTILNVGLLSTILG